MKFALCIVALFWASASSFELGMVADVEGYTSGRMKVSGDFISNDDTCALRDSGLRYRARYGDLLFIMDGYKVKYVSLDILYTCFTFAAAYGGWQEYIQNPIVMLLNGTYERRLKGNLYGEFTSAIHPFLGGDKGIIYEIGIGALLSKKRRYHIGAYAMQDVLQSGNNLSFGGSVSVGVWDR